LVNPSGEPNGTAVLQGEPNQAAEMSQYNLPKSVIGCFDIIARNIEQKTVIVIDNAPTHRSEEFEEKINEWEELGLQIYYLPTYCPSLNKIEMLWQKIKYDWPSWAAYTSYKNLCEELDKVLSQIGSKYYITFA
jgi:transposase